MDKHMWYIYTQEQYSAIKRNEVLIRITTQMNLDNTALGESSQPRKVIRRTIPSV